MKKSNIVISCVILIVIAIILVLINSRYNIHIGIAQRDNNIKVSDAKPSDANEIIDSKKTDASQGAPTAKEPAELVTIGTDQSTEFYTDITAFDQHLDGLTDVDPQYIRAMRETLEKRIRRNFPIAWPYKGNVDIVGCENGGDVTSNTQLAAEMYDELVVIRKSIGMSELDSRSKNNPNNCSVVICDFNGTPFAEISRNGYYPEAEVASVERSAKLAETQYSQQEPAMKRAVWVAMMSYLLMCKETANGSNYFQRDGDAERVADSPKSAKLLSEIPAKFVHYSATGGQVQFPTLFPSSKMDVGIDKNGNWFCGVHALPNEVLSYLREDSPDSRPGR